MTLAADAHPMGRTRPFAPFEWQLAFRYLRAKRKESFISVISMFSLIGIALGVATLIIVMSVMNGFRADIMDRILGFKGHIKVYGLSDQKLYDYQPLADKIRALQGVTRVSAMVEGQAMMSTENYSTGGIVWGLSDHDLQALTIVSHNILEGNLDNWPERNGLLLGDRLANNYLGVGVGGVVKLISPNGAVTPFGRMPQVKSYPVQAIFSVGVSEYDASIAILPLKEAQLFFNMGDAVSYLDIMLDNPDRVEEVRRKILDILRPNTYVRDWREENKTFFDALVVERNVMFMILTLIILVAAFNIISGLIMLVKDKGQDIAVLRSMGVTRGAIMRIFCMTGSAIGIVGTVIGVILGVTIALNIEAIRQFLQHTFQIVLFDPQIYFLSQMPSDVNPHEVIAIVLMSLVLSFLATLYPSWRAARMDPVDALRYE